MNSGMSKVKRTNDAPQQALICVNHAFRGTIIYSRAYFCHIPAFRERGLKLVNIPVQLSAFLHSFVCRNQIWSEGSPTLLMVCQELLLTCRPLA